MQSSIVHKLFALLSVISEAQKPLTFSEIVTKTGLNKSTIHRLLSIGVAEDVLRFEPLKKVYVLGPRVFGLVRNAHRNHDIHEVALDEMINLHEKFDINVTIGVPSGNEVIYLRMLESSQPIGGVQRPGMREPVHCSAAGKAMLAYSRPPTLDAQLRNYEFSSSTAHTITDVAAFKAELEWVRAHGYARNDREDYDHILGISAPIFNHLGDVMAALNIWSSRPRHQMSDLQGWSGALIASANRITEMVGGIHPNPSPAKRS